MAPINRSRVTGLARGEIIPNRCGDAKGAAIAPEDPAPAIREKPWREPYDLLLAFVESQSADERDQLRPRLRWACSELKRRTWFLRRHGYRRGEPNIAQLDKEFRPPIGEDGSIDYSAIVVNTSQRDQNLGPAIERLAKLLRVNQEKIDADSWRLIHDEIFRLSYYDG